MSGNNEYKRYFIILQEDDKGYEISAGKIPTGYVKIEIKNGKCKLTAFVQNVKNGDKLEYRFVLISPNKKLAVDIGKIVVDGSGRGELNYEFEADNVLNSRLDISEFAVAAVTSSNAIPLSGYAGRDKMSWKNNYEIINRLETEERIDKKKLVEEAQGPIQIKKPQPVEMKKEVKVEEVEEKIEKKPKEIVVEEVEEKIEKKPKEIMVEEVEEKIEKKPKEIIVEEVEEKIEKKPEEIMVEEVEEKIEKKPEVIKVEKIEEIMPAEKPEVKVEVKQEYKPYIETELKAEIVIETEPMMMPKKAEEPVEKMHDVCTPHIMEEPKYEYYYYEDEEEEKDEKCDKNEKCKHECEEKKHKHVEDKKEDICEKHPYYNSPMYKRLNKVIDRLKKYEPFEERDRNYEWFKVEDDVYMMNNAAIPFMGAIMPLGYPYMMEDCAMMIGQKDYIFGIKYDKDSKKHDTRHIKYVFFGIPGMYNKRDEMCYKMKGYAYFRPHKTNNYGYWIMCVDLRTGQVKL